MNVLGDLNKVVPDVEGEELFDIEAAILLTGMVDLKSLCQPDSDKAQCDCLLEAVDAGIAANESVMEFKRRLNALGKEVVIAAKTTLKDLW